MLCCREELLALGRCLLLLGHVAKDDDQAVDLAVVYDARGAVDDGEERAVLAEEAVLAIRQRRPVAEDAEPRAFLSREAGAVRVQVMDGVMHPASQELSI